MGGLKALVTAEVIREKLDSAFGGEVDFIYDGYCIGHEVMPHDELLRKIKGVDILVCEYDTISRDVFDAADSLKFIVCCRGGVKSVIDIDTAAERGVIVCNNAGRNAGAVTDMAMAFILDMTRNVTLTNNLIHSRRLVGEVSTKPWEYRDTVWGLNDESPFQRYRGRSVNHMALGIVGYGNAGRRLGEKAHVFGMRILAYDPYCDFADCPGYVEQVPWDRLIAQSDVISLHCVLTPQTRNLFGAEEFAAMKNGSYFVNTARGELVVEEDLVGALKSGHLAGAAIDVTRKEPIPATSPLIDAPNLIVTPHIAGSADDVQACGTDMVLASISAYLAGKKPPHAVVYR